MAQESVAQQTSNLGHGDEHGHKQQMLGPILCWAVVFADIGTSVYYTPGVLYGTAGIGTLAGFFVFLTMSVFVLLTLKYAEVTHRFPQGGGVVTVGAEAINPWFGALGGMFILVDYFLTAAISCLSGMQYLSVVIVPLGALVTVPGLGTLQLFLLLLTIVILVLLGILNWVGISESAKVSFVGAVIAFASDIAILITVFSHLSFGEFLSLFPKMFAGHVITPTTILIGFAGSFLAFSGLESISQLSPVMKQPHKKVAGIALLLVVLTIGITSPLLTMFSTLLQPKEANDPVLNAQIVSLLAGHWGNIALQTEVAISACALLVFASNTAIIGAYHVFLALSRMDFLPGFILQRNKLRGTPHFSIALATGIPILVLILVKGNINILGDMYAFGLLGAFSLTCLGLDIVRYRDWKRARQATQNFNNNGNNNSHNNGHVQSHQRNGQEATDVHDLMRSNVQVPTPAQGNGVIGGEVTAAPEEAKSLWFKIEFFLGVLTTALVIIAWSTNLVSKPLATAFGGTVTIIGMIIAYVNYARHEKQGIVPVPVVVTRIQERLPGSTLAVLTAGSAHKNDNSAVIRAAINNAKENDTPAMFLYLGEPQERATVPRMMEIVDPYLDDQQAKETFGMAEALALREKVPVRRYVYLQAQPDIVAQVWQFMHPRDTVVAAGEKEEIKDINPDRIRYELTPTGKVTHLLKRW